MKIINCILLFLFLAIIVYIFARPSVGDAEKKEIIVYRDSIVKDTIRDTTCRMVMKYVVRHDTLVVNDTVYKLLPISYYEFEDSSYRFVVEGYNVKPIFFETYPTTHYVMTERVKETTKQKRVTSGFNVGIGAFYGTKGLDIGVYAGYGIIIKF